MLTFLKGPSYKRGPPKGYIHAIEQRWHQVESLLGAILQCPDPRVQNIVYDLRQDDLAREILGRVDSGPYVCSAFTVMRLEISRFFRDQLVVVLSLPMQQKKISLLLF